MGQQPIMKAIQLVDFGEIGVGAQQIGPRRAGEALPIQSPVTARRDEPMCDQNEQHMIPTCALAARR
jgi:hypothetical protein